ncbi:MAG: 16S rRNA (guanine(966)-N(2))-methyltransferase RsmD [Chlamydiota bacterium]
MSLRIIGGTFRNRPIHSPKGDQTRPTLAVLRKAVFDILQDAILDVDFLDVFAGSGAMGLEALSRGAARASFVENNRLALRCIESNIEQLGVKDQTRVYSSDAFHTLKRLAKTGPRFDIVYIDPPYEDNIKEQLLKELLLFLDAHPILNPGGTLFLEEAVPAATLPQTTSLQFVNSRTFSRSVLHQFRQPV